MSALLTSAGALLLVVGIVFALCGHLTIGGRLTALAFLCAVAGWAASHPVRLL